MAKEPGHQGARNKPLKPLRREGRMIPATPVVITVCFHTGRGCTGVFPGPSYFEGRFSCTAWAVHAAEIEGACRRSYRGPSFETHRFAMLLRTIMW